MNSKKVLIIIVLVLFAGVVTTSIVLEYLNKKSSEQQAQQQNTIIENKQVIDKEKPFDIEINYPYVAGADDFNKKVEETIGKELNDFKTISLENDQLVKETDPENYAKYPRQYYLSIAYDKGIVNENKVSLVFNISNYTGGAHGANYSKSLNYNLKEIREIALTDLFVGQADYLQKISDFCISDLTKQIEDLTGSTEGLWINDGAGLKQENFSVFLINQDNIVFYFPQYQVAPYALGDFKVTYPL